METLAFVEIVDRHKDVLARHPVYRWPVRIGRGYQADVILDDAFVAPVHAVIEPAGSGRYAVSDLGSLNGILRPESEQRLDVADVGPDDLLRLGHTQIRIRPSSYAVPRERPLRALALYRRGAAFMLIAALTIALFLWNGWIMIGVDDERYASLFKTTGILIMVVAVWISVWSFVSSAIGRRSNFSAHGFVACAGIITLAASESFFDYLSFGFDARWIGYIGIVATATIIAYMLYRHLLLTTRARRKQLGFVGTGVSVVLCAAVAALNLAVDRSQDGKQRYNHSIKAPGFLLVPGTSPNAFISEAATLKRKVDEMEQRK